VSPIVLNDYAPNGVQVGRKKGNQPVCYWCNSFQALIDAALSTRPTAIFVHHGYFGKTKFSGCVGMKYRRISALIKHDISLYVIIYH